MLDDVGREYLLDTRGTILINLDQLADARTDFIEIVELSNADTRLKARAFLQLGRICAKLNDLTKAREYLNEALDIDRKIDVFTVDERSEIKTIIQRSGVEDVDK